MTLCPRCNGACFPDEYNDLTCINCGGHAGPQPVPFPLLYGKRELPDDDAPAPMTDKEMSARYRAKHREEQRVYAQAYRARHKGAAGYATAVGPR